MPFCLAVSRGMVAHRTSFVSSKYGTQFLKKIGLKGWSLVSVQLPRQPKLCNELTGEYVSNRLSSLIRHGICLHKLCEIVRDHQNVHIVSLSLRKRTENVHA